MKSKTSESQMNTIDATTGTHLSEKQESRQLCQPVEKGTRIAKIKLKYRENQGNLRKDSSFRQGYRSRTRNKETEAK